MNTKINNRKNRNGDVTRVEIRAASKYGGKYLASVLPSEVPTVRTTIERFMDLLFNNTFNVEGVN